MKTLVSLIILSFGISSCALNNATRSSGGDVKASGIYQKGHDLTEPRPKSGEYLRVTDGGVVILAAGAGLYVRTEVIKKPEQELFVTIDYEDPLRGKISHTMSFPPTARILEFSAPRFQKGLVPYQKYRAVIKIWPNKDASSPIETIIQDIRSYVDTRGSTPKVVSRLRTQ